jgi:D-cysteine desulfhydrase family pyridoxal phosphate-dependent enzyme
MTRVSRPDLAAALDRIPRVELAALPTPLDAALRLAAALGGPEIWIKRDDLTGLCFGGNKTRQLEYVFADLLAKDCDTVVAGAYTQSNWCRQMTAAAKKLGLDISLILLHGEKGPVLQGNYLLYRLMGAAIDVVDLPSLELLQPYLDAKAKELRAAGRRPYIVEPMGASNLSLGAVGYVRAALELDGQWEAARLDPDWLVISGANMTPAGLLLGLKALGRKVRLINVAPVKWTEDRAVDIARIANNTAGRLEIATRLEPAEVENHDEYIGERYGRMTDGCREALRLVARTEGVILDPVYSGKAMAGLIDQVRSGRIRKGESIVFVHTGGTPALFAYAQDLGLEA